MFYVPFVITEWLEISIVLLFWSVAYRYPSGV